MGAGGGTRKDQETRVQFLLSSLAGCVTLNCFSCLVFSFLIHKVKGSPRPW